jgi:hypothetical protein
VERVSDLGIVIDDRYQMRGFCVLGIAVRGHQLILLFVWQRHEPIDVTDPVNVISAILNEALLEALTIFALQEGRNGHYY